MQRQINVLSPTWQGDFPAVQVFVPTDSLEISVLAWTFILCQRGGRQLRLSKGNPKAGAAQRGPKNEQSWKQVRVF